MRAYELFEYQEYGLYGGWISNDNKIYGTDVVQDHLELIQKQGFGSLERAFDAGWVRMIWYSPGWTMEGTAPAVKRAFRLISRRLFAEAKSIHVDVLDDPFDRFERSSSEYFIFPAQKTELLEFINRL